MTPNLPGIRNRALLIPAALVKVSYGTPVFWHFLIVERRAGYKPAPTSTVMPTNVENTYCGLSLTAYHTLGPGNRLLQLTQVNRSINPSSRRKPESRTLGSRHALFRGISWIPAFAGTTVAWVATVALVAKVAKVAKVAWVALVKTRLTWQPFGTINPALPHLPTLPAR